MHRDTGRSVSLHLFQEFSTLGQQFAHTLLFRRGARPSAVRGPVLTTECIVWLCSIPIRRSVAEIKDLFGFVS